MSLGFKASKYIFCMSLNSTNDIIKVILCHSPVCFLQCQSNVLCSMNVFPHRQHTWPLIQDVSFDDCTLQNAEWRNNHNEGNHMVSILCVVLCCGDERASLCKNHLLQTSHKMSFNLTNYIHKHSTQYSRNESNLRVKHTEETICASFSNIAGIYTAVRELI